jgi:type II secretory pathway pseudopilin PulG
MSPPTPAAARPLSRRRRRQRGLLRRCGLTLIDTMMSIAISSSLLVAVGAAFNSSSKAIQNNDQFTTAVQAARVSINQIMTEVRRCAQYPSVSADHKTIDMMTYALEHRIYTYLANNTLVITRENVNPWVTNVIAANVTGCSFDDDGKTITMTVTIEVGSNQMVLTGSATPRRSVQYN